jgi:predicted metal-dependent hydrolase
MTSGEYLSIEYGKETIECRIIRRARKTLEISVEPDTSVLVVAPLDAELEVIAAKLRKRAAWIKRQQNFFAQFLPRMPDRQFVPGETHLYLGRQYRLKVITHVQQGVKLTRGHFVVQTHRAQSPEVTRELLESWYHERAYAKFAERIEVNLKRFPDGERRRPNGLIVRHLKQRWGSMSANARIILNRRLIEAPIDTIDYVITHELCHITEPNHASTFYELLARVMPDWERRKLVLERIMA